MPHRKLPIIAIFMVLALAGIASIRPVSHPAATTLPAAALGPTAILPPAATSHPNPADGPIRRTAPSTDPTHTAIHAPTNSPDTSKPRRHIPPKADADPTPNQNLKVLPKNLTDDQMEVIMTRYEKQLGVTCLYCHVKTKPDVFPERMDFASDEKPEKSIAREMIKMTNRINYKYFGGKKHEDILRVQTVVTCKTCHRGLPKPII